MDQTTAKEIIKETNYLELTELLKALKKRKTSYYLQRIPQLNGPAKAQYLENLQRV